MGLKSNQLKQLQRLYRSRLPQTSFTTPEFAQRLAAISTEIKQPICAFANRRGQIIRVGLGTPNQAKIPPMELPRYGDERLCGLRCISTSLNREPPTLADLTAMAMQRLDTLVTLTLNASGSGHVDRAYISHLLPNSHADTDQAWSVSPPVSLDAIAKQDFLDLVIGLEEEFKRDFISQVVEDNQDRVILAGLVEDRPHKNFTNRILPPPQVSLQTGKAMPYSLMELSQLVESAGGVVLDMLWQKRDRPQPQTILGEGKVQELAIAAQTQRANLIVFDRELSPSQSRNLERQIGVRVSDRTEVILDIFAQRAQSAAGKLQVELAQLEYRLPRLSGKGQELSRLGGGIGTRGPGETKLESDRRVIQKRITHLQHQVNQLQDQRARVRQRRVDREVPTLAIVGYTNAGKSTLLNALTKSDVFAANKLFATLDPTTRRLNLTVDDEDNSRGLKTCTVLITDTVGFIHELPPSLMDAFRATLEEVTEADALLHVVDASHPAWESQVAAVNQILKEMPIAVGPTLMVFNKIDQIEDRDLAAIEAQYPEAILISAINRGGLDLLCQAILPLVEYAVGEF